MIGTLLIAGAALAAQTQAPQPVLIRRQAPSAVVHGADTCLPVQMSGALPVISASLAGTPLKLGFDTGAPGGPHINNAVLSRLKLPQIGEAHVSDPSLQNPIAVGIFDVKDLKLGGFTIDSWQATGEDARPDRLGEPDGIIGLDAFAGFVVTIDYPGRRILVNKGRLPQADGKTSFHYEGPIPRVPLSVEGKTIDAHLDTGNARYAVILPAAFASRLSRHGDQFPIGTAGTVNNRFDLMAQPIGEAKIGDLQLFAGTAAFPSPSPFGNLGSLLLRDFVVKVDPANGIVALERARPGLENGCPSA